MGWWVVALICLAGSAVCFWMARRQEAQAEVQERTDAVIEDMDQYRRGDL